MCIYDSFFVHLTLSGYCVSKLTISENVNESIAKEYSNRERKVT